LTGLSAALFLGLLPAFEFGFEARGYGLTLGLAAAVIYTWSEAAAGRRVRRNLMLMAVALAAGIWTHYYFVLMFVPVAIGELVRQRRAGRVAWPPWLALAGAAGLVLPLWPFIQVASRQRGIFWAKPSDWQILSTYQELFGARKIWLPLVAVLVAIVAVEATRRWRARAWPRGVPAHEAAAGLALVALPVAAVALGHAANAFLPRYIAFATVGLVVAITVAVLILNPATGIGDLVLAGMLPTAFVQFSSDVARHPPSWPDPVTGYPGLVDWLKGPNPLALSGGTLFLRTWYALPEDAKARVTYPADPATQHRVNGDDTVDRGYLTLARWTPIRVVPIDDWFREHPRFYLYALEPNWTMEAMKQRGSVIQRGRERTGEGELYEVVARESGKE
jgi:hypothetical protein